MVKNLKTKIRRVKLLGGSASTTHHIMHLKDLTALFLFAALREKNPYKINKFVA
jgi:hypothetical protein